MRKNVKDIYVHSKLLNILTCLCAIALFRYIVAESNPSVDFFFLSAPELAHVPEKKFLVKLELQGLVARNVSQVAGETDDVV